MRTEHWVYEKPDFTAQLQAISQSIPLQQGLRLDLMYEEEDGAWMIHYALLDSSNNLLPHATICEREVQAYFRILDSEMRVTVHQQRVKPGTRFFVVAGGYRVAEGIATEILHLLDQD